MLLELHQNLQHNSLWLHIKITAEQTWTPSARQYWFNISACGHRPMVCCFEHRMPIQNLLQLVRHVMSLLRWCLPCLARDWLMFQFSAHQQALCIMCHLQVLYQLKRLSRICFWKMEALHVTYYTVNMADCSSPFKRSVITTYHHSLSTV